MAKLLFFMVLFLASVSVHSEIYQWTDSVGNVHFGDQPHQGSVEIKLPSTSAYSHSSANSSSNNRVVGKNVKKKSLQGTRY